VCYLELIRDNNLIDGTIIRRFFRSGNKIMEQKPKLLEQARAVAGVLAMAQETIRGYSWA
jgi:hypothetical protein